MRIERQPAFAKSPTRQNRYGDGAATAGKRQSGGRPPQSKNGGQAGESRSTSTVWRRYEWSWDVNSQP